MIDNLRHRPIADSVAAGFVSAFVVSASGVIEFLRMSNEDAAAVYMGLVIGPFVLGLALMVSPTWRSFGLGMVLASMAVVVVSVALIAYVVVSIGSQLG